MVFILVDISMNKYDFDKKLNFMVEMPWFNGFK